MQFLSHSNLISQRYLAIQCLAITLLDVFPAAVLVGGGLNSLGFYYDFILDQPLMKSMLELIEVRLHQLMKEAQPIRYISMMRENAQNLFELHGHVFLAKQAGEEPFNIIDLVQIGEFYGLCPESNLQSTQDIGYVKLLEIQHIHKEIEGESIRVNRLIGTNQLSARDLKKFLKEYDSFLKRKDHRMWGPKLNLFSFHEKMGDLGVVWHAKGLKLQQILQSWLEMQQPWSIQRIATPSVIRQDFSPLKLEERLDSFVFDDQEYGLRLSPLRQHLAFWQKIPLELEELPWKLTEYAAVYRHYPDSQRWGLFCYCAYLMDYTTICCHKKQLTSEIISSLHFIEQIITIFGFEARWYLIAFRQKSLKARHEQEAIGWLKQAVQSVCAFPVQSELQEQDETEGPRLELRILDSIGREWPTASLNVILHIKELSSLPDPSLVVLTRQIWGSLDRFIALLIERYEGVLPLWLAPEQVRVIVIGEANQAYAMQVSQQLRQKGLRVELDARQAKLNIRVHEAEKENVPYLILIGEQERIKQKINVREAGRFNQNQMIDLETFLNKVYQDSLPPVSVMERKTMLKGESELA